MGDPIRTIIMDKKLVFTYDNQTIDHLGVKLYSTIPPMLAELISNAWDADAHNVYIELKNEDEKYISVKDDGCGMSFDELNSKFLKIGRNRRTELQNDRTDGGRPVLGKKGLGKLSMFGIGKIITVTSVKNGKKNSFVMDYNRIKTENNTVYEPEILCLDEDTDEQNGTAIRIEEIKRKSAFDLQSIRLGIVNRFRIFSSDFVVYINDEIKIDRCDINDEDFQFTWEFPRDFKDGAIDKALLEFGTINGVVGKIYTSATPLRNMQQGIVLFSRNKLVQEAKTFNNRGNDNFFMYMAGYFNVDFVDKDMAVDNCSTDRKSLAWDTFENDDLEQLNSLLENIVKVTQKKWRESRKNEKRKEISEKGYDIEKWLNTLTPAEQPLAKKLTSAIIENDSISSDNAAMYLGYIKDMYGFSSFRDFSAKLDEMDALKNEDAIKLLTDWNIIESKEYAKIATGRISTIEQFEKYVRNNASETKVIQKFLEEFPWLLDPKMSKFEREVTYTNLLKRQFDDSAKPEHDRRIDFLCTDNGGEIHVIELKRPSIKITEKELLQISEYVEFIETQFPKTVGHVKGYLISNNMSLAPGISKMAKSLESNNIYIKSYSDLLAEARRYNKDLYDEYVKISEAKVGDDGIG